MEQQPMDQQQQPAYTPRPKWQVILARVALVIFVLLVLAYYINIARGGL